MSDESIWVGSARKPAPAPTAREERDARLARLRALSPATLADLPDAQAELERIEAELANEAARDDAIAKAEQLEQERDAAERELELERLRAELEKLMGKRRQSLVAVEKALDDLVASIGAAVSFDADLQNLNAAIHGEPRNPKTNTAIENRIAARLQTIGIWGLPKRFGSAGAEPLATPARRRA